MLLDFWNCRRPNDGEVMFLHYAWKPYFAFRLLIYAPAILTLLGLCLARGRRKLLALVPALPLGVPFLVMLVHPAWKPFFAFRLLIYATAIVTLLGLYLARRQRKPLALLPALLLGIPFLLDVGSFRAQVLLTTPTLDMEKSPPGVFQVAAVPYQTRRSQQPPAGLAEARFQYMTQLPAAHYTILYGFSGWDPCVPAFRTDFVSSGVFEMFRARGGKPTDSLANAFPPNDDALKKLLGGDMPKLRLVRQVQVARRPRKHGVSSRPCPTRFPPPCSSRTTRGSSTRPSPTVENPWGSWKWKSFRGTRFRFTRSWKAKILPGWYTPNAWHPDWKATVDGRTVPVVRANLGFKAVQIEKRNARGALAIRSEASNLRDLVLCPDRDGIWIDTMWRAGGHRDPRTAGRAGCRKVYEACHPNLAVAFTASIAVFPCKPGNFAVFLRDRS